jgi:hypothetical protein
MGKPIIGTVKYFQPRTEWRGTSIVWFFTVASYEGGHSGSLIPVEIEGSRFVGAIRPGDVVEVKGKWKEGNKPLRVKEVYNRTLGCKAGRK